MAEVVVVEDDLATQRVLHDVAARLGHCVRSFNEPALAIDAIRQHQPDVLVTDWDLGSLLSGINVALYVLAVEPTAHIIFITGNDMSKLKQQTRQMPNVHYIPKPFTLGTLRQTVAEACAKLD